MYAITIFSEYSNFGKKFQSLDIVNTKEEVEKLMCWHHNPKEVWEDKSYYDDSDYDDDNNEIPMSKTIRYLCGYDDGVRYHHYIKSI